jgi:glyoxylase-like metal-dependent hydrolase (beta-lactamase superfamily II)
VTYERGLVQVGDHTYAFLQPDGGWGWSNAGLIVGNNEAILVDTFMDLANTRELLDSVERATDRPVRNLVNTHHNGDHTWGNQLVEGARVIGHHRCRAELISGTQPTMLAALKNADDAEGALGYMKKAFAPFDFSGIDLVPPTVTFEDRLWLHPGGVGVQLEYFGPCHTLGDIVAWVPDERVLFAGDLAFIGCTPLVWEGSILNWIETVEALIALRPNVIVPGHGPVTDVDGLRSMEMYLRHLVSAGAALKEKGLTPLEASYELDLGPYEAWKEPERVVLNLMRLWLELDGHRASERIDGLSAFDAMATYAAQRAA